MLLSVTVSSRANGITLFTKIIDCCYIMVSKKGGVGLKYKVQYSCMSHIGKCRTMNQDNYSCGGVYMKDGEAPPDSISGYLDFEKNNLIAIFDGMGGEECGEIAAMIASEEASKLTAGKEPVNELLRFCKEANEKICAYQQEHGITAMGTTAAILAFTKKEIGLCNIGDTRIFRFADGNLEQLSVDHYGTAVYGRKPPLSQNLGIPSSLIAIDPYLAKGEYNNGDMYLLCSDGLTDMVDHDSIKSILAEQPFEKATGALIDKALENGGRDNVTVILCRVESNKKSFFSKLKNINKADKKGANKNGK